jgi:hypothetical protein
MATMTMSIEDDVLSRFVNELCTQPQRTVIELALQSGTLATINYNVSTETVDMIVDVDAVRMGFRIDQEGQVARAWQVEPYGDELVPRFVYDCALAEARDMATRNKSLEAALWTWYEATPVELLPHFLHVGEGDEPCRCKYCVMVRQLLDETSQEEIVTREELAGRVANLEEALRVWYHATLMELKSHLPEGDDLCSCEFCVMTREMLGEGCPL